ncbi:MAG: hypothetical protein ACI4TK_08405 [Agathobacter sp.]
MKEKVPTYNDGFVKIYRKKESNLTVNRNITSLSELDFLINLAYSEMSRRQQDMEFAEQNSFSLSLKIKTPKPFIKKGLDTSCFAVIENTLYSIQYIDTNRTEYFFYLEKIRELED